MGEFGNVGTGQCNWSACVDHARAKGWSVIGWCWNGDGNSANMLTPAWKDNGSAQEFTKSAYFNVVYDKLKVVV